MDQSSIGKFTRSIIKYSYNTISINIHKSKWTYNMNSLVMPGVWHLWCILVPSSLLAKAPPAWKTPVVDHPEGMAAVPAMCAPARMAAKHHADDLPRMTCLQRAKEKKHEKGWKQCVLASLHPLPEYRYCFLVSCKPSCFINNAWKLPGAASIDKDQGIPNLVQEVYGT